MNNASADLLTKKLRAATAQAHENIENQLDVFGPDGSVQHYANLLQRWLWFFEAWEPAAAVCLAPLDDFLSRRSRIAALKADLLVCGITPVSAPIAAPCNLGPIFPHHRAIALGTLYVNEGSTLGGQIISKTIEKKLGFTPENGGRFYAGYGSQTMPMWNQTKKFLDTAEPQIADQVVTAADDTFRFLADWLSISRHPR